MRALDVPVGGVCRNVRTFLTVPPVCLVFRAGKSCAGRMSWIFVFRDSEYVVVEAGCLRRRHSGAVSMSAEERRAVFRIVLCGEYLSTLRQVLEYFPQSTLARSARAVTVFRSGTTGKANGFFEGTGLRKGGGMLPLCHEKRAWQSVRLKRDVPEWHDSHSGALHFADCRNRRRIPLLSGESGTR